MKSMVKSFALVLLTFSAFSLSTISSQASDEVDCGMTASCDVDTSDSKIISASSHSDSDSSSDNDSGDSDNSSKDSHSDNDSDNDSGGDDD
jgi:hypothetical protein